MSSRVRWTCVVVLVANGALLVLQLVAGRLLAPFIGASLETWTAVIGMILAGISSGNAVGGRLADRSATARTLRLVLVGGALATLSSLSVVMLLRGTGVLRPIPLVPRIALLTFVTCFPPAFCLSLLTPVAIRIALPDTQHTGSVVGLIYALGTLGSLVGNFLTGFVLVAYLSTDVIVGGVAALLVLLAAVTFAWEVQADAGGRAAGEAGVGAGRTPAPIPDAPAAGASLPLPLACTIVFVASFCAMGLEIGASRLAAPLLGVSLYTWTGIIGVVLAGTAVGNRGGGWIADRWPRRDVLGFCLLLAGLATLWLVALQHVLARASWLAEMQKIPAVLLWTAMLYLPVMIALGTISPQVTRLAVTELARAGRVAGQVYAWSCAGAIIGTFATGFALIRLLGMLKLLVSIGVLLVLSGVLAGRMTRRPSELAASLVVTAGVILALRHGEMLVSRFALETNYFSISVTSRRQKGSPESYRMLVLDVLVHSVLLGRDVEENGVKTWRANPSHLGYAHEQVQAELAIAAGLHRPAHLLVIGGGGYTLPRWIEHHLPRVTCEVVEIDPGVTEVSHVWLGLPRDTRIVSHHMDGRQFVQEVAAAGRYQLVMQDAVNDIAVPYHLMTREYNDAIRRILTPDGAYLLTVIDDVGEGRLYRAAITTMQQSFAHVSVLSSASMPHTGRREIMVIYGSQQPLDTAALLRVLEKAGATPMVTEVQSAGAMRRQLEAKPPLVLTDIYAPVDNLIALEFRRAHSGPVESGAP